jgi:hypothetical protein
VKNLIARPLNSATWWIVLLGPIVLGLAGCADPLTPLRKLPPGSLTSWTHTGNFGPWQSRVIVTGVVHTKDGSVSISHYDGAAGWMGFGPHDVVEGLVLQPTPAP